MKRNKQLLLCEAPKLPPTPPFVSPHLPAFTCPHQTRYAHDEIELIRSEIASLSARCKAASSSSLSQWEKRSILLKCIHVRTLMPWTASSTTTGSGASGCSSSTSGVDLEFAKMLALNAAAQSANIQEKRIGYLACMLLLHRQDPFRYAEEEIIEY